MPTWGTFDGEHVAVSFNDDFFDAILRSPPVEGLVKEKAEQMLAEAKRIAPEDTGEYKQSLHIETVEHEHRKTYMVVSDDEAFRRTVEKIAGFDAAHGTVLYFDDTAVTDDLAARFPLYADNFPVWAEQSNGMLQLAVWTALSEAGLGANVQHYNPLIDQAVREEFALPQQWRLIAQMPFGDVVDPAGEKTVVPVEERVRVIGL